MQIQTWIGRVGAGVALLVCSACSTSAWYEGFQGSAYRRCDALPSHDERLRCREANRPDEERYRKEREALQSRN